MLKGTTVLVTGSTGQVARKLTEQLVEHNEVWAAARFTDADARSQLEARGVKTAVFTLGDEDLSGLPDVEYVLHCGCDTFPKDTDRAFATNAEGTGFLMQRYRDARGFFHMSSSSVYRVPPSKREPTLETDALGGYAVYAPHYAMSKLATEAVVRFQARALGLPAVIARLDVAYGANGHGGVPMVLYEMLRAGHGYTRAEAGESYCSPIHEDDIAEQVQRLVLKATVPATTVNLGGDEVVSVEQMIAYLEELTGLEMKIETGPDAAWGMKVLDNTLRRELAGPCKVKWQDGMRAALAARHPDALPS